jgi:hypothetical protein
MKGGKYMRFVAKMEGAIRFQMEGICKDRVE